MAARTFDEVKAALLANIASNATLQNLLTDTRTTAVYMQLLDIFAAEIVILEQNTVNYLRLVEDRAAASVVNSLPWYGWVTKNIFQVGDTLTFDFETGTYGYAAYSEDKKIVKYAAAEQEGSRIIIKALKEVASVATVLSGGEVTALQNFWNKYTATGTFVEVRSQAADEVDLVCLIEVDTDIIDSTGLLIGSSPAEYPVQDVIDAFYIGFQTENDFNSTFYIQDLEKKILAVKGVKNIVITSCVATPSGGTPIDIFNSSRRKYVAAAGWLTEGSGTSITYTAG